jgi:hypothetical protein
MENERMDSERDSERLGVEYRSALKRYEESVAFWNANPIAYSVGPGQRVPATSFEVLLEADRRGTPDEAWGEAMGALARWRALRSAHGMP